MSIRDLRTVENYQFTTLGELRTFLNGFKETDLDAVTVEGVVKNYITLSWYDETLSDGSTVSSVEVK